MKGFGFGCANIVNKYVLVKGGRLWEGSWVLLDWLRFCQNGLLRLCRLGIGAPRLSRSPPGAPEQGVRVCLRGRFLWQEIFLLFESPGGSLSGGSPPGGGSCVGVAQDGNWAYLGG